jgi:CheY-like chemotaxis protein
VTPQRRVLVIEDDDIIRESLVDFLGDNGYAAFGAVHGREAMDKLHAGPVPCLIVLDLMMPVMDGQAFREQQLQDPSLSGIPTVVMSAHRNVEHVAEEVSAVGYLKKPLKLEKVLELVQRHCSHS